MNCDYVREVYADVMHGRAAAETVTAVRAHLAGCMDCREEVRLVEALHAATVAVPAALHERVMGDLANASPARGPAPRRLAMAATVAAALIGGTVLLNNDRSRSNPAGTASEDGGLGFVTVEAAMVSGTGSLQDLTVEELEQLLGEIES
jgi:anti-sigma factor RsiW